MPVGQSVYRPRRLAATWRLRFFYVCNLSTAFALDGFPGTRKVKI